MKALQAKILTSTNPTSIASQCTNLFIPLYEHLKPLTSSNKPLFVGISAPQGCGKTTMTSYIQLLFESEGRSCLSLSLDDFYLTGLEQDTIAAANPANPLLQCRGNAGTHDVGLMLDTLRSLVLLSESALSCSEVRVPRYDKSLRGGRGDRAKPSEWLVVTDPVDVVLVEGWMMGFRQAEAENPLHQELFSKYPGLEDINRELSRYAPIHHMINAWIVLKLHNLFTLRSTVTRWRTEAEESMRASGRDGMSNSEVADFVGRYVPAYELCLPTLYSSGPDTSPSSQLIVEVEIAEDRSALGLVCRHIESDESSAVS